MTVDWGAGRKPRPFFFMRYQFLAALTCCTVAGLALAESTPQKKAAAPSSKTVQAPAQKGAAKTSTAKTSAPKTRTAGVKPLPGRSTASGSTAGGSAASRSTAAHPATTGSKAGVSAPSRTASRGRYANYWRQPARRYPPIQAVPTADRYREIQDALAAQGYLKTPSTGVWDKDSIDAMQRFQKDRNLEPTGKLTARSLAGLGLGPKPQETSLLAPNPTASLSANPGNESTPLQ
jgi:hypothetical protein